MSFFDMFDLVPGPSRFSDLGIFGTGFGPLFLSPSPSIGPGINGHRRSMEMVRPTPLAYSLATGLLPSLLTWLQQRLWRPSHSGDCCPISSTGGFPSETGAMMTSYVELPFQSRRYFFQKPWREALHRGLAMSYVLVACLLWLALFRLGGFWIAFRFFSTIEGNGFAILAWADMTWVYIAWHAVILAIRFIIQVLDNTA